MAKKKKECKNCKSYIKIGENDCCRQFAEIKLGKRVFMETKTLRSEKGFCGLDAKFFCLNEKIKESKNVENNITIG